MRERRVARLFLLALLVGCAAQRQIEFFTRTSTGGRPAAGRTVAVLPPVRVGGEVAPAVVATRALALVFAGDIADVHFAGPQATVAKLQQTPWAFPAIQRAVASRRLPSDLAPDGPTATILDSDMVAGEKRERRQVVTLRQSALAEPLGPASLEPELLQPLNCDYALVSVPFGAYAQHSHIIALYGFLPFAGSKNLLPLTPRGVYLLYDCASGEKVWESQIGTLPSGSTRRARRPAASFTAEDRSLPVVGAAYLLTGDIETPLGRLLDGFGETEAMTSAPADTVSEASKNTIEERLQELQHLRDHGMITPDEYERKRKEILQEL